MVDMYNGIAISELRLIVHSVAFTMVFLVMVVALVFWVYTSHTMKNPKEKERLRKLREKAQDDELAKKQLEKIKRKNKRKRKCERENIITDVIIWSISACIAIVTPTCGIIPGWTDYIKKDYVVYTGEITVYQQNRRSRIELDDGTIVWGIGEFDVDDTYGTVIYSKRTKQFLGGSNQ